MNDLNRDLAYNLIEVYSVSKTRGEFVEIVKNLSDIGYDEGWIKIIWEVLNCASE